MTKKTDIYFDYDKGDFIGLDNQVMNILIERFVGINLTDELIKMRIWLLKKNDKSRKGTLQFILNWLNKPQLKPNNYGLNYKPPEPVLTEYKPYLEELWKNSTHLLNSNTSTE